MTSAQPDSSPRGFDRELELRDEGYRLRATEPTWPRDPDFTLEEERDYRKKLVGWGRQWGLGPEAEERLFCSMPTTELVDVLMLVEEWTRNHAAFDSDAEIDPQGRVTHQDISPDFLRVWRRRPLPNLILHRRDWDSDPDSIDASLDAYQQPHTSSAGAASSWRPIDVEVLLAGGLEPVLPTQLVTRNDGVGLFYGDGRVHHVMGPPESLKSLFAQLAVARVLLDGGRALYIVHDGDAADVVRHLLAFNVPPDVITSRLVLIQPDEPLS